MQHSYGTLSFDGTPIAHLLAAVRANNFALVDELLPIVGVDSQDAIGTTPLQAAAGSGSEKMVRHLLDRGASLDAATKRGTPITWFAQQGWTDLVDLCLSNQHSPFASSERQDSAFVASAKRGNCDAMRLMISRASWDDTTKQQQLVAALVGCQSKAVAELTVTLGLDPHTALEGGETPIFTLVRLGATEACLQMVGRGANVNHRAEGYAAVFYAALYNKPETMLALLEAGADEEDITPSRENLAQAVSKAQSGIQQAYAAFLARRATNAAVSAAILGRNTGRS
jgi:ankyrin repeat protein